MSRRNTTLRFFAAVVVAELAAVATTLLMGCELPVVPYAMIVPVCLVPSLVLFLIADRRDGRLISAIMGFAIPFAGFEAWFVGIWVTESTLGYFLTTILLGAGIASYLELRLQLVWRLTGRACDK